MDMKAERKDLKILMEHFRVCCQKRLELWLESPVEVSSVGDLELQVRHAQSELSMTFVPRQCRWQLSDSGISESGDFDHLTKRIRQLLTQTIPQSK